MLEIAETFLSQGAGMIVVTGATGQLGKLVVEELLKTVPSSQIVAAVRDPQKAQDLAAKGVEIRQADYAQPQSLAAAFAGADKVLLVSSSQVGQRVAQHEAVIDAARAAGVKLLVYTSILNADSSHLMLAQEHKATEAYLRASGMAFTLLRNGWYTENHTGSLAAAVEHGVVLGAAKDGRFATATRADYAAAAAAVLTGKGHENKVYELGGDQPYTLAELSAEVARQTGKPVVYKDLPQAEYAKSLTGFGLPEGLAAAIADADAGASRGELNTQSHDLSMLIGRSTTSLQQAITAALK